MPFQTVYKPIEKLPKIFPGGGLTPPKFIPTYYEWLREQGTQVIRGFLAERNGTFYTVPEHHTFFLTSASLSLRNFGVSDVIGGIQIGSEDSDFICSVMLVGGGVINQPRTGFSNKDFTIPIRIEQNTIISLYGSTADANQCAQIIGFVVHNSLIPNV